MLTSLIQSGWYKGVEVDGRAKVDKSGLFGPSISSPVHRQLSSLKTSFVPLGRPIFSFRPVHFFDFIVHFQGPSTLDLLRTHLFN